MRIISHLYLKALIIRSDTDKKIKVVPERLFQAAGTTLTLPTAIKMNIK